MMASAWSRRRRSAETSVSLAIQPVTGWLVLFCGPVPRAAMPNEPPPGPKKSRAPDANPLAQRDRSPSRRKMAVYTTRSAAWSLIKMRSLYLAVKFLRLG